MLGPVAAMARGRLAPGIAPGLSAGPSSVGQLDCSVSIRLPSVPTAARKEDFAELGRPEDRTTASCRRPARNS